MFAKTQEPFFIIMQPFPVLWRLLYLKKLGWVSSDEVGKACWRKLQCPLLTFNECQITKDVNWFFDRTGEIITFNKCQMLNIFQEGWQTSRLCIFIECLLSCVESDTLKVHECQMF